MNKMKQYAATLALTAIAVGLSGCRTSMVGFKRPVVRNGSECLGGVPFQLTKPVFSLKETPLSGGRSKYALDVQWVGDTESQYTLNVDPALFTSIDFAMVFGTHGELTSTASASREEITPTITAVGEFVATGIGIASSLSSGGIFARGDGSKTAEPAYKLLKARLVTMMEDNGLIPPKADPHAKPSRTWVATLWDPGYLPAPGAALPAYRSCTPKRYADAHWRSPTDEEVTTLHALAGAISEKAFSDLTPLTPGQRTWIATARRLVMCEQAAPSARIELVVRKALVDKVESLLKETPNAMTTGDQSAISRGAIKAYIKAIFERSVDDKELKDKLKAQVKAKREQLLKRYPSAEASRIVSDSRSPAFAAKEVAEATKQVASEIKAELGLIVALLRADDQWRWQLVQMYEGRMHAIERKAARAGATALPPEHATTRQQWLLVIDAIGAGKREREIETLLSAGPRPAPLPAGHQPRAARDYAMLRRELVDIRKVITTKRNAVKPTARPRSERTLQPSLLVRRDGNASSGKWVARELKKLKQKPEFVLVREKGHQK